MSAAGPDPAAALDTAVSELEAAAARLRAGDLDSDEAAALVERCAELAARLASELDRAARAASDPAPTGQETLL
jgi:exonuclease VII small subunit